MKHQKSNQYQTEEGQEESQEEEEEEEDEELWENTTLGDQWLQLLHLIH